MQLKPNRWKVIVSLIPLFLFGLSFLFVFNEKIGLDFFAPIFVLAYLSFFYLAIPFQAFLENFEMYKNVGFWLSFPEISLLGLFLLALIYSSLLYLLISLFQKKPASVDKK